MLAFELQRREIQLFLLDFYILLKLTAKKSLQMVNCLFYNITFNFLENETWGFSGSKKIK